MSDDLDMAVHPTGLDRREFVKRGAIVGGIVWAAPVIQSIGSPAFAFTPLDGALSYVAFVVTCNGTDYRVKFEIDDWAWDPSPGQTPFCAEPAGWEDATKADGGALQIAVTGNSSRVCFDLSGTNCVFANGGTAGGARGDHHPQGKGFCAGPDAGATSTHACFSDPR